MLNKFFQNTRRPEGRLGWLMLKSMNAGHAKLSAWALGFLPLAEDAAVLDVGCGGGANLAALLRLCPRGRAAGLDYSPLAVAESRRYLAPAGDRCSVVQGDAGDLPFPDGSFDGATAFETVYFWPDLPRAFGELRRVLRPGGRLLIACECCDPADTTWTRRIPGMTIYDPQDLAARLEAAGFRQVRVHRKGPWGCVTAVRE